jgi:hypothetical protein
MLGEYSNIGQCPTEPRLGSRVQQLILTLKRPYTSLDVDDQQLILWNNEVRCLKIRTIFTLLMV